MGLPRRVRRWITAAFWILWGVRGISLFLVDLGPAERPIEVAAWLALGAVVLADWMNVPDEA